ncbi:class I SAM-dependent methyltransferase [Paenibacillus arenosi]|uniref:Class I SAM-dependent methyltransferase n=1 Tax=Paenibacillus arenosi TaxID=2774142 RepID=A0ABR9B1P5_9BACL|nr:class I SAM-dependent methyltransferase [Paenibacillus arenosi]MBD8500295.1 class I SAM-dependent methyltransferase [Paenibacillus arenosi]
MKAWYEQSFGEDYLLVYKHRDMQGAVEEVQRMVSWLELPEGAHILDLCCGMGRHSLALAEAGYQVTGMDLSEVLLREARLHDQAEQVEFVHGDMRKLPFENTFDAVVNVFTSFGYFEKDEENSQVITEVSRVLKPGAPFLIDFLNPTYIEIHLVAESEREDEGNRITETRKIEDGCVKKHIILTHLETGEARHYDERVKLYGRESFEQMFSSAGLQLDAVFGGYDGAPYDSETSKRLIMIGHKR